MAVTFNPQLMTSKVSFKQGENPIPVATPVAPPPVATAPVVAATPVAPAVKKHGLANFASKVAYGWINFTENLKGGVKGLFAAAAVGTGIAGADWLISGLQKTFKPSGEVVGTMAQRLATMFKTATQVLGVVGKVVAPIVAVAVFGGNLIAARLKANKRTANVDHQLYTNHRA